VTIEGSPVKMKSKIICLGCIYSILLMTSAFSVRQRKLNVDFSILWCITVVKDCGFAG